MISSSSIIKNSFFLPYLEFTKQNTFLLKNTIILIILEIKKIFYILKL